MMIDVLIFAVIAGVLVFKLWSQLGKKGDRDNNSSFDPFIEDLPNNEEQNLKKHSNNNKFANENIIDAEYEEIEKNNNAIPDYSQYGSASKGLTKIKKQDKSFNPEQFLQGTEIAFEIILDNFAKGNKKELKNLLGKELYQSFSNAINERTKKGESMIDTLIGIDKTNIKDASLKNDIASITINIYSQQVNAHYDHQNVLISGDEHSTIPKTDTWTFERKINSKDPNWLLVAT